MNKSKMIGIALAARHEEEVLLGEQANKEARKNREFMTEKLTKLFGEPVRVTGDIFRLGKIELALDRSGRRLHVVKDCPYCKHRIYSIGIYSLASIGKALVGEWNWASHWCPEKEKGEHKTPAEKALSLLCELQEIVGPILPE